MLALLSLLSACSLPVTMVFRTVSSVLPVGEPAVDSLVRTIATPLSRSLLSSDGLRRHSVIRVETSPLIEALLLALELVVSDADPVVPAIDEDGDVAVAPDVESVEAALPVEPVPATLLEGLVESLVADEDVEAEPYVELVPVGLDVALEPLVPIGDSVPATPEVPVVP